MHHLQFYFMLLGTKICLFFPLGGYWLSGTNLGNGEFYWASTGTAVIYSKWLPNQPDNAKLQDNDFKGENCIQWGIYNRSENAAWNDLECFHKLRYICEEHQYCS
ncbi:hypothetical protein GWI33_011896 [Rhynchophorus ferrugineus]|uniref:C-type lectin domain-containing protein n=1 Tax=Rhynchophorus ferrugineus TaxID=354439 RepID=A0A834MEI0_RHYFE|nr:hypothetical protein GWI33_011896 [Rhynchophorus ferrugineus]